MAIGDPPNHPAALRPPALSAQDIDAMRRERDALALRIQQSQETVERSKDLLRRLDELLAAHDG
jgi:hypothetical protein